MRKIHLYIIAFILLLCSCTKNNGINPSVIPQPIIMEFYCYHISTIDTGANSNSYGESDFNIDSIGTDGDWLKQITTVDSIPKYISTFIVYQNGSYYNSVPCQTWENYMSIPNSNTTKTVKFQNNQIIFTSVKKFFKQSGIEWFTTIEYYHKISNLNIHKPPTCL